MAEGLPDDGKLITCDIDLETTQIAKKHWSQSPHGKKIELKLGPALETLKTIEGLFDLVFIDADKMNYINYWELCLPKIRRGGLLVIDNVLWSGSVLNPEDETEKEIAKKNLEKCRQCGFCDEIACGSRYVGYYEECMGCGACSLACPYEAIQMIDGQKST
jgi:caffeoyl-CoA O-methyltransferase